MHRYLRYGLGIAALIAFGVGAAHAQELDAVKTKTYPVYNTGGFKIKIDAQYGDWDFAKTVLVMGKDSWEPLGGTRDNDKDITARMRAVYDANNLYFAAIVDDDEYVADGANPWENDGAQLAIDSSGGKIAAGWPNGTTHLYNFAIKNGWLKEAGPFQGDAEIQMKRDEGAKQTLFEWRMPSDIFAKKGTELKAGAQIAFAIIFNDSDKNAPGQTGWVGWGNHTIVFGKNPEEMQTLVLDAKALSVEPDGKATTTWAGLRVP